ncbi:MAG TPA: universal stress protein [Candidatus Limnocylindrales bacterium]|nr:universal stress protein [Candidatus Limnocylindrales bacterium]
MRVLLATDGSEPADVARHLLTGIDWPAGSTIRVVTAVEGASALFGMPWAMPTTPRVDRYEEDLVAQAESVLEAAARGLSRTGIATERAVMRGRAASAIAHEAAEWGADLVVVGSRGHGSIATMLLGSVSAEVVDHAPCPVLVARSRTLSRIVLGHDGSEHASAAEELLREWPIFRRCAVEVTSVVPTPVAWYSGLGPAMSIESAEFYREGLEQSMREHEEVAAGAAKRLIEAGLHAASSVVEGLPAAELIRVADDRQADLIMIGTHGRTGLGRLLLGSVARNVLTHAPVSVLVVRPTTGANGTNLTT